MGQEISGAESLRARMRRLVPSPARAPRRFAGLPPEDVALLARRDAEVDRVTRRARTRNAALAGPR